MKLESGVINRLLRNGWLPEKIKDKKNIYYFKSQTIGTKKIAAQKTF